MSVFFLCLEQAVNSFAWPQLLTDITGSKNYSIEINNLVADGLTYFYVLMSDHIKSHSNPTMPKE